MGNLGSKIKKARKQWSCGLLTSFDIDFSGAAGSNTLPQNVL